MKWLSAVACALVLAPGLALAQEAPEEGVEEVPADEAPAPDAAGGVEEVAEPAAGEEAAEAPAGEALADEAADAGAGGWGSGYVDVYYVPTFNSGTPGTDVHGDGAGGRAQWRFWRALAVAGEYTTHTTDVDEKFSDQRAGLGLMVGNDSGDTGGLWVQFERLDFADQGRVIDGLGVHGRMSHATNDWFRFYADIGYQRLEDDIEKYSGFEFNAGAVATFGPVGVFADWRRNQLEGKDTGTRSHLEVVRIGARYAFGGGA